MFLESMWRHRWRVMVFAFLVVAGSVGVGRVVQVLSVDGLQDVDSLAVYQQAPAPPLNTTLGPHMDQLVWFMQLSDLHLSVWQDPARTEQFRRFCEHTVPAVQPSVILASGDLTDAKSENGMGSRQYEGEWRAYSDILRSTGLHNATLWLDVRGNHDNFDLSSLRSPANMYSVYSVQGRRRPRSYLHSLHTRGVSVAFIAVDATLLPGPKRPFNFVGVLPASELALLRQLAEQARVSHNHTVWFGHYPTSCIITPTGVHGIRSVMAGGLTYLCGHLHSLGGLVPAMHTRQQTGALELELEDWKDGRKFRVLALDQGIFSFVDVRYNNWPIILITNPKDALYRLPGKEPLQLLATSTHVRVLVWSIVPLLKVVAKLSHGDWFPLHHVEGPLYVAAWDPTPYSYGLHTIHVMATDAEGREQVIQQPFSLDGSQPGFRFWPRLLLMSNISAVFQFLFACSVCVCVLPLCIVKYLHHTVAQSGQRNICRAGIFRSLFLRALLRKFWVLSSVDKIFWPFILYSLYLPVGPWLVGELLDNKYGVVFAWGTFVNSSFLPGSLTYAYGFALNITYIIPLMIGLSHCIDCRMQHLFLRSRTGIMCYSCKNFAVLIPIILQAFLSYLMYLAYGWMSVFVGPIRSWSVVLGVVLWIQCERLPASELEEVARVWYGEGVGRELASTVSVSRMDAVDAWLRAAGPSAATNGSSAQDKLNGGDGGEAAPSAHMKYLTEDRKHEEKDFEKRDSFEADEIAGVARTRL